MNTMRPVLAQFSEEMETVLKRNDFKGGWDRYPMDFLFFKLLEEIAELHKAMQTKEGVYGECVDVANFAMMIADTFKNGKQERITNRA